MAGETVITVVGNLTGDPELRFTQSGAAVADFTVATNPRTFDRNRGEWVDGSSLFLRCSVWREMADNVAESLRKGMRVIVQGRLTQRSYETREGERRTVTELQVDEVGPSLRRAQAKVVRNQQPQGQQGSAWGNGPGTSYTHGRDQVPQQQEVPGHTQPQQTQEQHYQSQGAPPQQVQQGYVDDPWRTSRTVDEPPF